MANILTFICAGCKQEFPLRIGAVRSEFMNGGHGEGVEARDAKNANAFVNAVTDHHCDAKLIQMSNNYAKAC